MENATQFGIYRIFIFLLLNIFGLNLFAQDYYVDLEGKQHEIEISSWNFDVFQYQEAGEIKTLAPHQVQTVYRSQAEVIYVPISSLLKTDHHQAFFIPTIQSLKALSTDNFRDENFEVWLTGDYVVYEVQNLGATFVKDINVNIESVEAYDVFIYSDKAGFNKIVSSKIENDAYKVLLSKYISRASLKDSIFNDKIPLKPKKFLSFFHENESPLTAIIHSDKDKAAYYIKTLKEEGALILLLNLDLKKIELYRNAGNEKLANQLEEGLLKDNLSYAYSFLDTQVFNFCNVYVTDAKNRSLILNGVKENIFLDKNLQIDSNVVLKEEFYLFARQGVLFETRLENSNYNTQKKIVSSTPVVQDAMVIYDVVNTQVVEPFPNYIRIATARFLINKKVAKGKKKENDQQFNDLVSKMKVTSGLNNFNLNALGVATSFNANFHNYYNKRGNEKVSNSKVYQWNAKYTYNSFLKWFEYQKPS